MSLDDGEGEEEISTPVPSLSRVQKQMEEEQHQSVSEWLRTLGDNTGLEVKIIRVEPKEWEGVKLKGYEKTVVGEITEEDLKAEFGGGLYKLQATVPNPKNYGRPKFFGTKMVEISGPPNINKYGRGPNGSRRDDPSVVSEAVHNMKEVYQDALNRANGSGGDMTATMIQFMNMMQESSKSTQREKDALYQKMFDMTQKREDPMSTQLLTDVLTKDSARIESLQINHQSEIRMMRENHNSEIKRLEDKFDRDLSFVRQQQQATMDDVKRSRDNEIRRLEESNKNNVEHLKMSHTVFVESLKRDVARLEAQVMKLEAENGALKERKEQTPMDKANEVFGLAGQMKELGLFGGDEEPKGRLDRLIDTVTENPSIMGRIFGSMAPETEEPKQLAPQLTQIGPPFAGPDQTLYTPLQDAQGTVFLRDPSGQLHELSPEDAQQLREHQTQAQADAKAHEAATRGPTNEELLQGSSLLEGAMKAGTPAENFALGAKTLIPAPIIRHLEQHGADGFIEQALKLNPDSQIKSQKGRNYVRKVVETLLG